jgi:hypothetical protein
VLYLSKQLATKVKSSKLTGERGPQTPRSSQAVVVAIKAEPMDPDEGLRKRLSSPIVITSSEEEDRTPKSKPAKGRSFPSSLSKQDFTSIRASKSVSHSGRQTPGPTPGLTHLGKSKEVTDETEPTLGSTRLRKGKEIAAEERLVDLPGRPGRNQPLAETTVYLEDM